MNAAPSQRDRRGVCHPHVAGVHDGFDVLRDGLRGEGRSRQPLGIHHSNPGDADDASALASQQQRMATSHPAPGAGDDNDTAVILSLSPADLSIPSRIKG
jgi:hypothetical protein